MSDLSLNGRSLVQAGKQADRPSSADRARVLEALRGRLGEAALLGASVAHAPVTAAGIRAARSKLVRWGWVGPTVLVSGALWFAPRLLHGPVQTAAVASPSASAPNVQQLVPVDSAAPDVVLPLALPSPDLGSSRPVESRKAARSRDGLSEEVALLSRAETELHAGRPSNALLALDEHQRKFPHGALAEERTAARIQALCALGRTDEANAQLKQLAHISPNSPHEERARQACSDPRAKP